MVAGTKRITWDAAPAPERADEHTLALRARTERAAFGRHYDRYLTPIYAYCYRRLGTREAAEDATAAVFTKALGAVGQYRADAPSFRAWLFAIAHNTVVDEVRARRWTTRLDPNTWDPIAPEPGPEEVAVVAAELARLRTLLATLPPDRARLVELRLAGLSDQEIAHVVGRSHGAVRVGLHRALAQLRSLLHPEEPPHA
jgi:RNA polymerase sigma-70 factor (ECF subfamily)